MRYSSGRKERGKLKTHQVFKMNQDTNQPPVSSIKVYFYYFLHSIPVFRNKITISNALISGDDGAPQGRHGDKTNKVRVNTAPLIGQQPSADADTGL